jgi:hypothetical protein
MLLMYIGTINLISSAAYVLRYLSCTDLVRRASATSVPGYTQLPKLHRGGGLATCWGAVQAEINLDQGGVNSVNQASPTFPRFLSSP